MGVLGDLLESSRDSYEEQLTALEEIHEEENESKNEAVKKYFKDIEIFEREFEDLDSSLSAEKEAALRSLLEDGSKDPDKLARDIAKLWGIDENS